MHAQAVKLDPITFDEICELEPAIRRAYHLAKMIGRRRGQPFCANGIFYTFLKPIIRHAVGWERVPSKPSEFKLLTLAELEAVEKNAPRRGLPEITYLGGNSLSQDPRLKTAMAYDVAYQTIYAALPDCNHSGMCW